MSPFELMLLDTVKDAPGTSICVYVPCAISGTVAIRSSREQSVIRSAFISTPSERLQFSSRRQKWSRCSNLRRSKLVSAAQLAKNRHFTHNPVIGAEGSRAGSVDGLLRDCCRFRCSLDVRTDVKLDFDNDARPPFPVSRTIRV